MMPDADPVDKLLVDVRKTIDNNRLFIQSLTDDAIDIDDSDSDSEENSHDSSADEYEEL